MGSNHSTTSRSSEVPPQRACSAAPAPVRKVVPRLLTHLCIKAPEPQRTNLFDRHKAKKLEIDYRNHDFSRRSMIGVERNHVIDQITPIAIDPPEPAINLSRVNDIFFQWQNRYKSSKVTEEFLTQFQSRIQEDAKELNASEHEAKDIRYSVERAKTKFMCDLGKSDLPKSSLNSLLPLSSQFESIKRHDLKYFGPKPDFPVLTPEIEERIALASRPYPPDEPLVDIDGAQILRKDIQTLLGNNWLNDEIMNAYMNLLVLRGQKSNYKKVYSFNTFFYPKLRDFGYNSVKRWTRRIDIFNYDFILVPVHLGNHWCLAFIDLIKRKIAYYDSMGGSDKRCCDILLNYLKDESNDKKKQDLDDENWIKVNCYREGIPQQMNGSDCGVFACTYAEYLTRMVTFNFSQRHMPYFRRKMIYEILEKKILE